MAVLSKEELYESFRLYQQTKEENIREKIIMHNIGLIKREIKLKFSNVSIERDELFQTGIVGLIKSVDTFSLDRNTQFSTYAIACIDHEIIKLIKKSQKIPVTISMEDTIFHNKEENQPIERIISDPNIHFVEDYEKNEEYQFIYSLLKQQLSKREQEIVKLICGFYDRTYSTREIGKMLGISHQYVNIIYHKALNKMKNNMIEKEQGTSKQYQKRIKIHT